MNTARQAVPSGVLRFDRPRLGLCWGFMRLGSIVSKILYPDRESLREAMKYLRSTKRITERIEASALRLAAKIPEMPQESKNGVTLEQFYAIIELILDAPRLEVYHNQGLEELNRRCASSVWFRTFRIRGCPRRVVLVGYQHHSFLMWDSPSLVIWMASIVTGGRIGPNKSEWIQLLQIAADPQFPLNPARPEHRGPAVYYLECEQDPSASPIALVESENHRRWVYVLDQEEVRFLGETMLRPGRGICRIAKDTGDVMRALSDIPLPLALHRESHDFGDTVAILPKWGDLTVKSQIVANTVHICTGTK